MSAPPGNRFALLDMDSDSADEGHVPLVEQPPIHVPLPVVSSPREQREWDRERGKERDSVRVWSIDEGKPTETREWNLERGHSLGTKRSPFARYAFRDEERPKVAVPRKYAFRDEESPPPERQKPVSPASPTQKTLHETSMPIEEFPKLTDYERPHSPPYPPDDGWYPTLAERVKLAMERHQIQETSGETKVIGMDTTIPMATRIAKNLVL